MLDFIGSPQDQYLADFAHSNDIPVSALSQASAGDQPNINDIYPDDGSALPTSPWGGSAPPVVAAPVAVAPLPPGAQKEVQSKSALDDLLGQLAAHRTADAAKDRNDMWMTFFSNLAANKSPSLGGAIADASSTLGPSMQTIEANNKARDYEGLKAQIAGEQYKQEMALKRATLEQGKYTPIKDFYGNVTGMVDTKTGVFTPVAGTSTSASGTAVSPADETPSADPQKAAAQILAEQGTVPTQVGNRFDIAGRNKQVDAYNNAALGAKSTIQQLNALNEQTGKYTPGKVMGAIYGGQSAIDMGGDGATARTEADKAAKALANSFMQQNVGAKGAGIRMVQFDSGAVPNADMTDDARTALINKNTAIANSQIQRAAISNMYPRMQMSNVNALMDNYEEKNPPILPSGDANPSWMPYKDWLKAGRPNTAAMPPTGNGTAPTTSQANSPDPALVAEARRRGLIQ